jgi:hypothetical protein
MRNLITILILFSASLCSQTYLNVHNNDGTHQNVLLNSLDKITFSANLDSIIYYLPVGVVTSNTTNSLKLSFDVFGMGEILPVELVSFSARVIQNKVTLSWRTATEVDNYGFEIERMQLSSAWNKVGFVEGHGNSNISISYSFIDKPLNGTNFKYRLKQINKNGEFTYSNIIDVVIGIPYKYELKQNYPNPFNPTTKIVYNVLMDGIVTLKVYDLIGREVISLVNENKKAGSYEVTFNGNLLPSSVYFCKMIAHNFTSSIKMLLIK